MLGPAMLSRVPGFSIWATYPQLTQPKYRSLVGNQAQQLGPGNITQDPNKMLATDVVHTLYTNSAGDMINLELTIVGDPTLIKQDDWLYSPNPSSSIYNSWDSLSQADFCTKYGHIRMDSGMLVVNITVNTVVDIDTDWQNQGLMAPNPPVKSLFSGLYKIITIKSSFLDGQFTQTLSMVRTSNSDTITNSTPTNAANSGAASRAQVGSVSNNFVNAGTATAASDGGSASTLQSNNQRTGP
jgi:hypothetical protein